MVVPEDVCLDCVEACQLQLQHSIAPKLLRRSAIVKGCAVDESVSIVNGEALRVIANNMRMPELRLILLEQSGSAIDSR
jgi:hypothetical protein